MRFRAKIEENTLFGKALVSVMVKIEKNTLFVELWLEKGQNSRKIPFLVGAWLK